MRPPQTLCKNFYLGTTVQKYLKSFLAVVCNWPFYHSCVLLTLQLLVLPLHPLQQDLLQDGLPPQLPQLLFTLSAPLLWHHPYVGIATCSAVHRAHAHSTRFQSISRMLWKTEKIWIFIQALIICFSWRYGNLEKTNRLTLFTSWMSKHGQLHQKSVVQKIFLLMVFNYKKIHIYMFI